MPKALPLSQSTKVLELGGQSGTVSFRNIPFQQQKQLNSKMGKGGAWVAQGVKASAFGSGRDARALGSSPASGSLLGREPASSSLSLSACFSAYL